MGQKPVFFFLAGRMEIEQSEYTKMLKSLILTFEISVPTTFPFMQFFSFFNHYDSSDGLAYYP